jgi:hypothetical protein
MRLAARIRLAEDALDEASAALRAAFAGITAPTPAG